MSKSRGEIAAMWSSEDAARTLILDRARLCAELTMPEVLPREQQQKQQRLPDNFQSIGATGVTTLVGKLMTVLFPPDIPWVELRPAPHILHSPSVPDERKQRMQTELFTDSLLIQKSIENADSAGYGRSGGDFRSNKLGSLTQLVVTGDTLEMMNPDLTMRWFRRDAYTTCRDSSGSVIAHTIRELVDVLSLSEEDFAETGLSMTDFRDKPPMERMRELFTRVEWQPQSKKWLSRQEINDRIVNEIDYDISPYFCTAARLVQGEDYGRGPVEARLGDLYSYDYLNRTMIDWAGMCSKMVPCIDNGTETQEEDLARPSGQPIRTEVRDGVVTRLAFLKIDKAQDFRVVYDTMEAKRRDLARAMLIESELAPNKDRVTATQIMRLAQELDGAVGGVLASISGQQQRPMADYAMSVLRKNKTLRTYAKDADGLDTVDINVVTGLATLTREAKANRLVQFFSVISQIGPDMLQAINRPVIVAAMARLFAIDEPGVVKTEQQMQAEVQQAIAAQTQQAIGQEAATVLGDVARNQLIPQGTQ